MPIIQWLPQYKGNWIKWDMIAGVTLASFVLPESMAYATLAGLPAHYGIILCAWLAEYSFAIFTSSKHVAVGPTSSISLMVGINCCYFIRRRSAKMDRHCRTGSLGGSCTMCDCLSAQTQFAG